MTAAGVTVRAAVPADLRAVAAIQERCNPAPWGLALVSSTILAERTAALVAEREGRPVGYLVAARMVDEWHVLDVGVVPPERRRGVGRALMASFLGHVDSTREPVTLEVRVSNAGARALYEGLGFAASGRRPGYYLDNGEDADVMWRPAGGAA